MPGLQSIDFSGQYLEHWFAHAFMLVLATMLSVLLVSTSHHITKLSTDFFAR